MTKRVIISNPFLGLCGMQVCACKDAKDDEILLICNAENPSGTRNGWAAVVREVQPGSLFHTPDKMPIQCEDDAERLHFIVLC